MLRQITKFLLGVALTAVVSQQVTISGTRHKYCCNSVISSGGRAKLREVDFWTFSVLTSGDFFKGLEYRDVDSSRQPTIAEFQKNGQVVSLFPEKLEVIVNCQTSAGLARKPTHIPSLAEVDDVSRLLKFDISWKAGVESRPADLLALPSLTMNPTPSKSDKRAIGWTYAFRVRASEIPLSEHLVISILGPDGEFLGRVTFDLRSALTPPLGPISKRGNEADDGWDRL